MILWIYVKEIIVIIQVKIYKVFINIIIINSYNYFNVYYINVNINNII